MNDIQACYMALFEHDEDCDFCNEGMTMTIPPDDSTSQGSTKEAYSEGGLSGEATVSTEHSEEGLKNADYEDGFRCGQNGGQNDDSKSEAWQRGWAKAQE